MITLITGSISFILSQSDFLVKLNVQTNRGTHTYENVEIRIRFQKKPLILVLS